MALKSQSRNEILTSPWPFYDSDEVNAVSKVLQSGKVNYWTGQEGRNFESEFSAYTHTARAIALANGSVTLECLLRAIDIQLGDEVIVTPRTFIASASSVVMQGGKPIFADVDRRSGNLTAKTIEEKITPKTKAIIAVHLAGWPVEMDEVMALAKAYGIFVIEDCAQAHGATYKGRPVGSIGDAGSWSFCQDKIMSTGGEGGMITTQNLDLADRCWSLKDHGKSYDAVYNQIHPIGFRWVHESIGTNWRMPEIQSAIGRIQLTKLKDWHDKRTINATILSNLIGGLSLLRVEHAPADSVHAYYKYYCYLNVDALKSGWSRERILREIESCGLPVYTGSCSEVYLEKSFTSLGLNPTERLPIAKELGETSLMFLVHPTLTPNQMNATGEVVRRVLLEATR